MAGVRVKIRGIYTTALTALLLERGFSIVSPSRAIRERFRIQGEEGPEEVAIFDRQDHQAVRLEGMEEALTRVVEAVRQALPHTLVRPLGLLPGLEQARGTLSWAQFLARTRRRYELEFPATAKAILDELRARTVPTLPGHHLLKAVDPQRVDQVEEELAPSSPLEERAQAAGGLKKELVYTHYAPGRNLVIAHVKPQGPVLELQGTVVRFQEDLGLTLKRTFRGGGTYDGLDLPKEEGDYGFVELKEGSWVVKRSYYAHDDSPKGELYNINTPVEFYPQGPRYVDLEVDVARFPDGTVRVLDHAVLEQQICQGFLSQELGQEALRLAHELKERLQQGEPIPHSP